MCYVLVRPNWFLCCKTALRIFHPVNPKNHLWSNPLSITIFRDKWHGKCTYMLNISKEQIESDEVAYPQKSYLVWLPSALPHTFSELLYNSSASISWAYHTYAKIGPLWDSVVHIWWIPKRNFHLDLSFVFGVVSSVECSHFLIKVYFHSVFLGFHLDLSLAFGLVECSHF